MHRQSFGLACARPPPPLRAARLADAKGLVKVAVPAADVRGHVDVDNVTVLQLPLVGDAVADDLGAEWGAAAAAVASRARARGRQGTSRQWLLCTLQ
jgi:hypothetical protein